MRGRTAAARPRSFWLHEEDAASGTAAAAERFWGSCHRDHAAAAAEDCNIKPPSGEAEQGPALKQTTPAHHAVLWPCLLLIAQQPPARCQQLGASGAESRAMVATGAVDVNQRPAETG